MAKYVWSTKKPIEPGYWWMTYRDTKPSLVTIEKRGKDLFLLGFGIKYYSDEILWQPVIPPKP